VSGTPRFDINGPDDVEGTLVLQLNDGQHAAMLNVLDIRQGIEVRAICQKCHAPMSTGQTVMVTELPIRPVGRWRHACGGVALMPVTCTVTDRHTGATFDMYATARERVTVSAITLAELLRLAQAARAVQLGRPGATDRLDRVLEESPEPVRRLKQRLKPADWIALATFVLSLVTYLTTTLKDDGAVTEKQLVTVIERMVEQGNSGDGDLHDPLREEEHPAGQPQAPDEAGPVGDDGGAGHGTQELSPDGP
jgi:hypothetical protein